MHPFNTIRSHFADLPTLGDTMLALGKLAIILALVALAWTIVNVLTTAFDDHKEIIERRTVPFILIRVSMLAGQVIATVPLVMVKSDNTKLDLLWLGLGGLGIIVVFNMLRPVLDKLLYGKLLSANVLRQASLATAIVQASFYLAVGLIIGGAFTGAAPSVSVAIRSTLLFTGLGLLVLLVAYLLAGKLYGMRRAVKHDDNRAAALILGSIVVGLGFMLQTAIAGDFNGWVTGLIGFAIYAVIGIIVLVAIVPLLDKLVLRKVSITGLVDGNAWQIAIVTATVIILVARAMSSIVI